MTETKGVKALDLFGRRPRAFRRATTAATIILLVSSSLVFVVMHQQSRDVLPGYNRAFESVQGNQSNWFELIKRTHVRVAARQFESAVAEMADSILAILQMHDESMRRIPSPGLCATRIVSSKYYREKIRERKTPHVQFDTLKSRYDTLIVYSGTQLHVHTGTKSDIDSAFTSSCHDSLYRYLLIAELISRPFLAFPAQFNTLDSMNCPDSIPSAYRHQFISSAMKDRSAAVFVMLQPDSVKLMNNRPQEMLDSAREKHVFLVARADTIDDSFDPFSRPWYKQLVASEDRAPVWTGPYDLYNEAISVVTVSYPIRDPRHGRILGVVGIDILAGNLIQESTTERSKSLNYVLTLVLTGFLLLTLFGIPRDRFDTLLWAFSLFVVYYTFVMLSWILQLDQSFGELHSLLLPGLSIANSVAFGLAAIQSFAAFKHHPYRQPEELRFGRLSGLLNRIEQSGLLTQVIGGAAASILTSFLSILLGVVFKTEALKLFEYLNMSIAALSLIVFGYYHFDWQKYYAPLLVRVGVIICFFCYALLQLSYSWFQHLPWIWDLAFYLKLGSFGAAIVSIYVWSNIFSFDAMRRAGSRSVILSRIASGEDYFTIAGVLNRDRILFVDLLTLLRLGVNATEERRDVGNNTAKRERTPRPNDCKYREVDFRNKLRLFGWTESDFGIDLFEPKDTVTLSEMFVDNSLKDIYDKIRLRAPDRKERFGLAEGATDRTVLLWYPQGKESNHIRSHTYCKLRFLQVGTESEFEKKESSQSKNSATISQEKVDAEIITYTVWRDEDRRRADADESGPQFTESDIYIVIFGRIL